MDYKPAPSDAIEELKIVQDLINCQENLHFKVFGWAIGIITAMTIGFFHETVKIPTFTYMTSGFICTGMFFWVASRHWIIFFGAAERSKKIEKELIDGTYQGIQIHPEIKIKMSTIDWVHRKRIIYPYLALAAVIVISGVSKHINFGLFFQCVQVASN
jgi:hypothetical protein